MDKAAAEKKLAKLGFGIDWSVTEKDPNGNGWWGTIDATDGKSVGPGCAGSVCWGKTASELYEAMIVEAKTLAPHLTPCADPHCDMHNPV